MSLENKVMYINYIYANLEFISDEDNKLLKTLEKEQTKMTNLKLTSNNSHIFIDCAIENRENEFWVYMYNKYPMENKILTLDIASYLIVASLIYISIKIYYIPLAKFMKIIFMV